MSLLTVSDFVLVIHYFAINEMWKCHPVLLLLEHSLHYRGDQHRPIRISYFCPNRPAYIKRERLEVFCDEQT